MEPNETLLGTRLFGELKIFEALKKHEEIPKNKTRVRATARALAQHVLRVRTSLLAKNTRDVCRRTTNKETHNHEDRNQRKRHRHTETQRRRDAETQRHRDTEKQRHRDTETQREREREREQRN